MAELGDERPDDCASRALYGTGSGFILGSILGAVMANWVDTPQVVRNQSLPALRQTGRIMGQYGTTFAAIGAAYSVTDCLAETIRGKKDSLNGVLGGAAAGAVIGLRTGSLPKGVQLGVGAAAVLAVSSLLTEVSQRKLQGEGLFPDGATPTRTIYPYPPPSTE